MKGPQKLLVVSLLSMLFMSCTEEAPTTTEIETQVISSQIDLSYYIDHPVSPRILRGALSGAGSQGSLASKTHPVSYASPLFGLSAAPNGDILVADAGAGVAVVHDGGGVVEFALPGVTDISPLGRGSLWASRTGLDPEVDSGQGLYRVSKGNNRLIANLFAFEAAYNPHHEAIDSNPFDVQSLGGSAALVADAGGNDLLRVDNQGNIDVLAIFPDQLVSTANIKSLVGCPNPADLCNLPDMMPAQAVPTSIAIGPDGYYYVGELKGFPAPAGASNIWRVSPNASSAVCGSSPDCVKVFDGGFTSIIDLAFDSNGRLTVAELDEDSWFAVEVLHAGVGGTINSCDLQTLTCTEVATGIPILTAIAFGKSGDLWATRNALIPGLADVVRVN